MEPKKETKDKSYLKDISVVSYHSQFDTIFFERASKRAEKIVTALYMVSDFIKDTEPIKFELRSTGLTLLAKTFDVSKNKGIAFKDILPDVLSASEKIISFLEVAATLSLISNMNYQILRNELMALRGSYESKFSNFGIDVRSFVGEEKAPEKKQIIPEQQAEKPAFPKVFYKGHVKDIFSKGHTSFSDKVLKTGDYKGQIINDNKNIININESTDIDKRKNKIISILKSRNSATIGEISVDIENVSEKTIQRDLQSLIDEGIVLRVGERRWSKYQLVNKAI